ncbi:hypothetical protein [Paradevosia shaoguanensis]|uniref:hypothetical protein n=1 Tax=Paradevosia shaoguanensis TaxID=1335043 RepID=UPI001FE2E05A|nr:hypothetical protein [Paradevosia shaoguanensis]
MISLNNPLDLPVRRWTLRRYGLLLGAALSAVGARYHIAVGTSKVLEPMHATALPREVTTIIDLMWWQIAALIVMGGVAMAVAAFRTEWRRPIAWLLGGHYLVISAICIAISYSWFGTPLGLFQWVIFGSLGLLTIWAAWR